MSKPHFNKTPSSFRDYYTLFKKHNEEIYEGTKNALTKLVSDEDDLYNEIKSIADRYKTEFKINLMVYREFVENTYIDGSFEKAVSKFFINKSNGYSLIKELYALKKLTKLLKDIKVLSDKQILAKKCLSLTLKEYSDILQNFYERVHKHMIVDGYGYVLPEPIGWLCINRTHAVNKRPTVDFSETRKKKEALLAAGKKLYNKEEAEFCRIHDIPYDGEKYTVYQKEKYFYEIVLVGCKIPNHVGIKFTSSNWVHRSLWKKTYDEMIAMCNGDINKICELPINLRVKLNMCLKADDKLYIKFIRNEAQLPLRHAALNRTDRQ